MQTISNTKSKIAFVSCPLCLWFHKCLNKMKCYYYNPIGWLSDGYAITFDKYCNTETIGE
jgi:hypothetical protein